ncbi:hypothetical protein GW17_00061344, partial [Ensete ventricosum]
MWYIGKSDLRFVLGEIVAVYAWLYGDLGFERLCYRISVGHRASSRGAYGGRGFSFHTRVARHPRSTYASAQAHGHHTSGLHCGFCFEICVARNPWSPHKAAGNLKAPSREL